MSEFEAPFRGSVQTVEDAWIDYNGHFNMAYYGVLFDRCGDEAFELVGLGPQYVKEANCSYFTLEAHLTYLQGLHAGSRVRTTLQMLDYDAKRIHYIQQMFHAEESWIAATMEVICIHVDMGAKRSSPFPPHIFEKIAAMRSAHAALPVPPQVGHRIGIVRKAA